MERILNAPMIAEPQGLYDCCGVSDDPACLIVTTPEIVLIMGKKELTTLNALQLVNSKGLEAGHMPGMRAIL